MACILHNIVRMKRTLAIVATASAYFSAIASGGCAMSAAEDELVEGSQAAVVSGPSREACETNGAIVNSVSALKKALAKGGKVLVRGGSYSVDSLTVNAGTTSKPTVLKPYNCESVKLNVKKSVEAKSNTVVAGLEIVQGAGCNYGQALRVSGSKNVVLRNNDLSNPCSKKVNGAITVSIRNGSSNVTVEGNYIHDCNEDCLQTKEVGPITIRCNEFEGPSHENLVDIKELSKDSLIADNLLRCDTLAGGCAILHGLTNTNASGTFRGNRLAGCPTSQNKQLHINGKPNVDNRYDIIDNIFTADKSCRAIQFKACNNCIFKDNGFYKTTVQKGSFSGKFKLKEDSGNVFKPTAHPGPDTLPATCGGKPKPKPKPGGSHAKLCDAQYGKVSGYQLCAASAGSCSFNAFKNRSSSCNDVCSTNGGSCLRAINNSTSAPCAAKDEVSCGVANHVDDICVCSLNSAPDCNELFGKTPGYMLCAETASSCSFNAFKDKSSSCSDVCATAGRKCLGVRNNSTSAPCTAKTEGSCAESNHIDDICICSR